MLFKIKKIQIFSILKVFPIIFTISGAMLGTILFLFNNSLATNLDFNFNAKLLLFLSFVLIYVVFMTLSSVVVTWIYNFVAGKLNCNVVIFLESEAIDCSTDYSGDKE
ncbi:MAG: hypothetical protein LBI98_02825 [Endomicrobium sp.]|jgi:ABC-type antimicrobial peptide transport system permease subunit|nr:hypothetical protein [Endomicrobium sp.]